KLVLHGLVDHIIRRHRARTRRWLRLWLRSWLWPRLLLGPVHEAVGLRLARFQSQTGLLDTSQNLVVFPPLRHDARQASRHPVDQSQVLLALADEGFT